jgi:cyclase
MKSVIVAGALLGAFSVARLHPVAANEVARSFVASQAESAALDMQNLNFDSLAILTGGGGHTIVFSTESGAVVVIDAKLPTAGQRVVDAVNIWTDHKPVTTVINTHSHVDHVGGNAAFAGPVDIVAHENTKANMTKMEGFQGQNTRFLPNKTYRDKMSLSFGNDRVDLHYFGEGHTNGDAVVVFPIQRIAYFGDLFPGKTVPVVDRSSGGNALAFPQTLAHAVAAIKGVTRVIPSHAMPPEGRRLHSQGRSWMSWTDLQEYADFTRDFVEAAKEARRAGKTVDEAANSLKITLSSKYQGYELEGTKAIVQAIYDEMNESDVRRKTR